jgi:hypothetical protein
MAGEARTNGIPIGVDFHPATHRELDRDFRPAVDTVMSVEFAHRVVDHLRSIPYTE